MIQSCFCFVINLYNGIASHFSSPKKNNLCRHRTKKNFCLIFSDLDYIKKAVVVIHIKKTSLIWIYCKFPHNVLLYYASVAWFVFFFCPYLYLNSEYQIGMYVLFEGPLIDISRTFYEKNFITTTYQNCNLPLSSSSSGTSNRINQIHNFSGSRNTHLN